MNKTAEEIYPYLENEESSIGIREHNQRMYDCRQAYNKGFAAAQFAAPPPASEGEMLQAEIKKCNEALMQPNFSIDNYRCYWEGRRALAEELLATLPTREQGGEERRLCSCFKNEVCGVCYESKGYVVADGILRKLPSPPKH